MNNNSALQDLFQFFWKDYISITPSAEQIHSLLRARGEQVVNDHIAFRTFNIDPIGVESLGKVFLDQGYYVSGEYDFEQKKLHAFSYAHPEPGMPHIFISELLTEKFSSELQAIVHSLVAQVPVEHRGSTKLVTELPTWDPISFEDYRRLIDESEYAGWLSAFGIRANHFTVLINALRSFESIQDFNDWLMEGGFEMNRSGGLVKGTPEELLEQSSIMASRMAWEFAGGQVHEVPTCYHEFARRYTDPATGRLYEGFIAKSADKIFESTDTRGEG